MQRIAVVSERNSAVCRDVCDVNVLVDVDDKLALGMNLDQHLLLVHHLDNLADVGALLGLGKKTILYNLI